MEKVWFFNSEYKDSFGVSYQGIVDFCASKKMRLCTFDEYCPNGRLNKPDEGNAFNSFNLISFPDFCEPNLKKFYAWVETPEIF